MNEIYEMIENKIKASGYPYFFKGEEIYNELCDLIEDKDNGTYIFMSKPFDDVTLEYNVTVMEDNFNLSTLTITTLDYTYSINFDE